MKKNDLILFIEINNLKFIFIAGFYNNENNFEIVEKIISPIKVFEKNKLINIDSASALVKKNVQIIEQKHNYIFKEVILILDAFDYSCINMHLALNSPLVLGSIEDF